MTPHRLCAFLAIGIAASTLIPYNFALTEDQVLMKVFQYGNPTLFPHDLLMESVAVYGPYNLFAWILSFVPSEILPVAMYAGWLSSWVLIALATCWGLENVFRSAHPLIATALFLTALGLSYRWQHYGGFILGDNDLIYPFLRNQTWAWCAALWGFWAHFKGRPIHVGLSLAIAMSLHVNTGQHLALLLVADTLVFGGWWILAQTALVACFVATPVLWPLIQAEFAQGSTTTHGSFVEISAHFRHPHHLVFSSWPLVLYVQYFIFLAVGFVCWWCKRSKSRLDYRLLCIVVSANAFMALGYVCVELWPIDLGAQLQFARMGLFVKVIWLVYLATTCSELCQIALKTDNASCRSASTRWTLTMLAIGLVAVAFRHTIHAPNPSGLEQFFRNNTSSSATVLLPPCQLFPSFGSRTERSMLVNGTLMPFTKPYYELYYRRLLESAGVTPRFDPTSVRSQNWNELLRRFNAQDSNALDALSRRYEFEYVVRMTALESSPLNWRIVYEDNRYRVYERPIRK